MSGCRIEEATDISGESDGSGGRRKHPNFGRFCRANACDSAWGRHFILRALRGSQVIERVGPYGRSNKLFSVERDTITEKQLLQPLLLIERRLHPQIRRSR